MPRELSKVLLPIYRIEPPDVVNIQAVHIVPRAPYHLRTLDVLAIQVEGTLPDAPIMGTYGIEPGGTVNLGPQYGPVNIAGLTVDEAKAAIEKHLRQYLREPVVSVTVVQMAIQQQIAGPNLVAADGTIHLGTYGSVPLVGLTLVEARRAIETHLSQFLDDPEVSVDIAGYNSKVYYIITQGGGAGDQIQRMPVTGNETVLDAISLLGGLSQASSKRIWIARPTKEPGNVQVLPVNWDAITAQASTGTNYQLLPGDRLFVAEDKAMAFSNRLATVLAPLEQLSGFALLGMGTVSRLSGNVLRGGSNRRNIF